MEQCDKSETDTQFENTAEYHTEEQLTYSVTMARKHVVRAPFPKKVYVDGQNLRLKDIVAVARWRAKADIVKGGQANIQYSNDLVEDLVKEGKIVYGITTGFGPLHEVFISKQDTETLQKEYMFNHAAAVGDPLPTEIIRAMMLLRANTFAKGHSGVRPKTIHTLIEMLNKGVHPLIPEKGSVGASGDLAPLAHMGLVLMGEGEAEYNGQIMTGMEAMKEAGIEPIILGSKEGLALTNGSQLMTAIGALTVYDALRLIKTAEIVCSMTLEGLRAAPQAFDDRAHQARPHKGQILCAKNIRSIIKGSKIIGSNKEKVQDAYSLRCSPQVLGASRDTIGYVRGILETEFNSATDNPLIFPEAGDSISCGNFHGQPIALAMDFLGIAIAEIANISERRIARLTDSKMNEGMPMFLVEESGLSSGFMIPQYTAASLVSENKVLAHPSSVDSIPTSGHQEDHVSMGTTAARHAREILENSQHVVAIELLCAAQAMDFRGSEKAGIGTKKAYDILRSRVDKLEMYRPMYKDMEKAFQIVRNGELISAVEGVVGKLH